MWQIRYILATLLLGCSAGPIAWSQEPAATSPTAQQLLSQSAAAMLAWPALEAEFRYRVHVFDETLQGTGHYRQTDHEGEKLFRLDLKTQLEETVVSQQIIANGNYLWIRLDGNFQPKPVVRVNLKQIRRIAGERYPGVPATTSPAMLALVSLPKMLTQLQVWFDFAPPREARIDNRLVWQLTGTLKPALLKSQLLTSNPHVEQIPNMIQLTLGRDEPLPLIPYRFDYLKLHPDGRTTSLLSLHFHTIHVSPQIAPHLFDYSPGDQEVEDHTSIWLQRLGLR